MVGWHKTSLVASGSDDASSKGGDSSLKLGWDRSCGGVDRVQMECSTSTRRGRHTLHTAHQHTVRRRTRKEKTGRQRRRGRIMSLKTREARWQCGHAARYIPRVSWSSSIVVLLSVDSLMPSPVFFTNTLRPENIDRQCYTNLVLDQSVYLV